MATCSGITRSGERCRGVAIDSTGLCYSHSPQHADARRRSASRGGRRGGRGRPVIDLSNLKQRLEGLAEDVIDGKVDRGNAAVAGQLLNYAIGAIRAGLRAKEVGELEGQLEELREMVERDSGRGEVRRASWGA